MAIIDENDLKLAIEQMRRVNTDLRSYELKAAAGGFPKSVGDSISAFANTTGGSIVLGISERNFHPVTTLDVKSVQTGCAQAARDGVEPPVMADIRVLSFEGAPVVVVNVPESPAREKPCYVRSKGMVGGSFVRTGDGDHRMSRYELDRFLENQHVNARNDIAIVEDATVSDLDAELLRGWLARTRSSSFGRLDGMDDEAIMANRRILVDDGNGLLRPTVAGLMAMGAYPQRFFPRLNVVFTSYPGSLKGELDARGGRFADAVNIDGPIPEMLVGAVRAASRNMRHGAIVQGALREDVPDYPLAAVREAVANALMHRDYSRDAQGTPVLVDLYPDRLEIINPGGLYGALTVDMLGSRGGTASRNQFLARVLEDVPYTDYDGKAGHVVENRGSGYPTITGELERALMGRPVVKSDLDEFRIIFRHRRMTEQEGSGYSKANVEAAVLAYLADRESASTAELARASGMSAKTMRGYITKLVDDGVVEGIGSRNSPKRRYRMVRG